jgi:hypothetical protein
VSLALLQNLMTRLMISTIKDKVKARLGEVADRRSMTND